MLAVETEDFHGVEGGWGGRVVDGFELGALEREFLRRRKGIGVGFAGHGTGE